MRICIYGAASDDIAEVFKKETELLGETLAKEGHSMVYGAGATGLMGAAARGFTKGNGEIIGVSPYFIEDFEDVYPKCTELIQTQTMSERKDEMEKRAEAFLIVPGGIGTFDEFYQCLTLKYLGRCDQEIILYNIDDFYTGLIKYMEYCMETGFIKERVRGLYKVASTPQEVLDILK